MHRDEKNAYRRLLEQNPPEFVDRVDTPWDHVPDLQDYNATAYRRIVRDLERIRRDNDKARSNGNASGAPSRGILILGEAGTGKTHLLMRVARNLSESNHILFVRKPNNEDAVGQHIWANIVNSLTRILPNSGRGQSQLDDLLAHVFSDVLIPELEQDIQNGVNVEQRKRWVNLLRANPFNLFLMLGEGEKRQDNLRAIRKRTLGYLQLHHPDVDLRIAHALITYCFVSRPDRKRILLTWLSGQDIDEVEAQNIGLPARWVDADESASNVSVQQQAEEQALRAIRTIGVLSTHYQPLILAFDQLEGLRGEERLTVRWGDIIREIFTMTPNFLVVTCIFPSLWDSWFRPTLERNPAQRSAAERIAQQMVELEKFKPEHGLLMLKTHLEPSFTRFRLPTAIFPFEEEDVSAICSDAASPRSFIQKARSRFEAWLDDVSDRPVVESGSHIVTQKAIDACIRGTLEKFDKEQRSAYGADIPVEQDFFGRIRNLLRTVLDLSEEEVEFGRAEYGARVMPPNVVVKSKNGGDSLCIAIANRVGNAFAARLRNCCAVLANGEQFNRLIMIRDSRCPRFGARNEETVDNFQRACNSFFLSAGVDEIAGLNALYDTLVAVEEHDLTVGRHEIDKRQLVEFLRNENYCGRTQLFRHASKWSKCTARAIGATDGLPHQEETEIAPPIVTIGTKSEEVRVAPEQPRHHSKEQPPQHARLTADVVIGDTELDSPHLGVVGDLKEDRRRLAVSFTKPQCMVILGYMGSGKSYSLGVLIESALLTTPGLIQQTRPMSVVAFNYRRNPESRFEYGGFARANSDEEQVAALRSRYGVEPAGVSQINILGYAPELARRSEDYGDIATYPIHFRSDELGAEHWEILMKPPSPQAEYMDVIRDIISKLYYEERLSFKNLEKGILTDERLSDVQRRRAMNRLSFAQNWIDDERQYDWADLLQEGAMNVFDLRMKTLGSSEALKLCLIVTDLVRRTRNGVNKLIVFDEAHEYVDCKELVGELENAITQIRHDGLSFILASQFPERIPKNIFKYLLTRLIFKIPTQEAINYLRRAAPNLAALSPQRVSNLDLEKGVCFIQTDDDCSDTVLRVPQLLEVRPRCTQHGGATVRQLGDDKSEQPANASPEQEASNPGRSPVSPGDEARTLAELNEEFGIPWFRFLALLGLPRDETITPYITLEEARRIASGKA